VSPRAGLDAELFLAGEDPVHGPAHAVEQAGRGGERDEVETGCRLGALSVDLGRALWKNGLSRVLKSARWMKLVPRFLRVP